MRIGLVTPRYPPSFAGGGEDSMRLLAEHLARADRVDDLVVFSFDGAGTETRRGVTVERLGDVPGTVTEWQNLRAYWPLRSRAEDFDLLHAHNMELNPAVGAIGAQVGVPTVAVLNSYHFFPPSVSNVSATPLERLYELVGGPTTRRLLLRCMANLDAFVAISETVRDIYAERGTDPSSITVVPEMVDPEFEVPEVSGESEPTLLYVGALSAIKGVDDLLRALIHLPGKYQLRVVGDGDRADNLRELAATLGVQDRTKFTGYVPEDELVAEYARADVFVHPGVWPEPFGRTLLEAMQARLPVVCTDIGGPSEIVRDPSLRCPPDSPSALAETIQHAYASAEDIGARNAAAVCERFAPDVVVPQFLDLYEDLLD